MNTTLAQRLNCHCGISAGNLSGSAHLLHIAGVGCDQAHQEALQLFVSAGIAHVSKRGHAAGSTGQFESRNANDRMYERHMFGLCFAHV